MATILKIAYGYSMETNDDPLVKIVEEGIKCTGQLLQPGRWYVELLPWRESASLFVSCAPLTHEPSVRFLPDLTGWRSFAKEMGEKLSKLDMTPFNWAVTQIVSSVFLFQRQ